MSKYKKCIKELFDLAEKMGEPDFTKCGGTVRVHSSPEGWDYTVTLTIESNLIRIDPMMNSTAKVKITDDSFRSEKLFDTEDAQLGNDDREILQDLHDAIEMYDAHLVTSDTLSRFQGIIDRISGSNFVDEKDQAAVIKRD